MEEPGAIPESNKARVFRERKEANRDVETTVMKCGWKRFCRDRGMRDLVEECVQYLSKAAVEASMLASLHVLRTLEADSPIEKLDHVFFDRCLSAIVNLGSRAHGQALTPELQLSLDMYLASRDEAGVSTTLRKPYMGQMKQTLSKEVATNFATMLSTTFVSRLGMWLRLQIYQSDSDYFREQGGRVIKSAVSLMVRSCLTPDATVSGLMNQYVRFREAPIPVDDLMWMHELCQRVRLEMGPQPLKIKSDPEAYMSWLRKMLIDVARHVQEHRDDRCVRGFRTFALLPQKQLRPVNVSISNTILKELIRSGLQGDDKDAYDLQSDKSQVWKQYFDLRQVGRVKHVVGLKTDGLSVSVIVARSKRAQKAFEADMPSESDLGRLVAIDPGRVSTFTGVVYDRDCERTLQEQQHGRNEVIQCSGRHFHNVCGHHDRSRITKRWTASQPNVTSFNEEAPSAKTADVQSYMVCIKHVHKYLDEMMAFYGSWRMRRLRWSTFIREQKGCDKLIHQITGGDERTVVAYGDGSFSATGKGNEGAPTSKFPKRLSKRCKFFWVDEFRTSKLCSACHEETRGMSDVYGVRLCTNTACHRTKWNRDVNAALNIMARFLETLRGIPRCERFCR